MAKSLQNLIELAFGCLIGEARVHRFIQIVFNVAEPGLEFNKALLQLRFEFRNACGVHQVVLVFNVRV